MKKHLPKILFVGLLLVIISYSEPKISATEVGSDECKAWCTVDYNDWACHCYAAGFYCVMVKNCKPPTSICDECVVIKHTDK